MEHACPAVDDGSTATGWWRRCTRPRRRSGEWSTIECVAASDEPVGSLMVETDAARGATPMAHRWGEQRVQKPFVRVAIHQGTFEVPDDEAETCDGVRVWELPC